MKVGARNVRWGLVLLPVGLLAGLALGLFAFVPLVQPPGFLRRYEDLPRRLLRLGHIAAVMLPALNVLLGPWIDRVRLSELARSVVSRLLLLGAPALPLALWVEAFWPAAAQLHVSTLPAMAFTLGALILAFGAARSQADALRREESS